MSDPFWQAANEGLRPKIGEKGTDRLRAVLRGVYGFSEKNELKEASRKYNALKKHFEYGTSAAKIESLLREGGLRTLSQMPGSRAEKTTQPTLRLTPSSIAELNEIRAKKSGCKFIFELVTVEKNGKPTSFLQFVSEFREPEKAYEKPRPPLLLKPRR